MTADDPKPASKLALADIGKVAFFETGPIKVRARLADIEPTVRRIERLDPQAADSLMITKVKLHLDGHRGEVEPFAVTVDADTTIMLTELKEHQ